MADVGSLAGLNSTLEAAFGPHLASVCQRSARALEATGFTGLLVHSGALQMIFEDDQPYSFQVNAAFKVWIPISDTADSFVYFQPGSPPQLLLHSPPDYWHKPTAVPQAYWTRHFDIVPVADRDAARKALPKSLNTTAYIGDAFPELSSWGVAAVNPPELTRRLDFVRAAKTAYEIECLREASRLG